MRHLSDYKRTTLYSGLFWWSQKCSGKWEKLLGDATIYEYRHIVVVRQFFLEFSHRQRRKNSHFTSFSLHYALYFLYWWHYAVGVCNASKWMEILFLIDSWHSFPLRWVPSYVRHGRKTTKMGNQNFHKKNSINL